MGIAPRHLLRIYKELMHPDDLAEMAPSLHKLISRPRIPDDVITVDVPARIVEDPIITGLREKVNVPSRNPYRDISQENFHQVMSDPETADIIVDNYLKLYPNAPGAQEALNEIIEGKIKSMEDKVDSLARTPQGREILEYTPDFRDLPPRSEISDLNRNLNRLRNEENKAYIFRQMLEGASEFPNMRMRVGDKIRDVSADARTWRLAQNLAEGIKKTFINAPVLFLGDYLVNRLFKTPQEERAAQ